MVSNIYEYPINIDIYGVVFKKAIELQDVSKHQDAIERMYINYIQNRTVSTALRCIKSDYPRLFEPLFNDLKNLESGNQLVKNSIHIINTVIKDTVNTHRDEEDSFNKSEKKQSIKEKKSTTKIDTKQKPCNKIDIMEEKSDLELMMESEGADTVIQELAEDYEIFKKFKIAEVYKEQSKKARQIAKKMRKQKSDEKANKQKRAQEIIDKVNSSLSSSTEKTRKRLINWIETIDSVDSPQELQDRVIDFLGGEFKEWKEGNPIEVKFPKLEKIINDKVNPVLNNIKPYYDMVMGIYNMDITLDTIVSVVSQIVLAQFAPFIDKYNQYTHTVNEIASLTTEINLLKEAVERKAGEYGVSTSVEIPIIPTLPPLKPIPNPFGSNKSPSEIEGA